MPVGPREGPLLAPLIHGRLPELLYMSCPVSSRPHEVGHAMSLVVELRYEPVKVAEVEADRHAEVVGLSQCPREPTD